MGYRRRKIFVYSPFFYVSAGWRNGSSSDSYSEVCGFESHSCKSHREVSKTQTSEKTQITEFVTEDIKRQKEKKG